MDSFYLSLIWWNTSLSPPIGSKRGKANESKKQAISTIIRKFMELGYEFICLGEVAPDDLEYFEESISPQTLGYFCAKGVEQSGRVYFDTCIYYKNYHRLVKHGVNDVQSFEMSSSSRTFKYGQKYRFMLGIGVNIVFYLSHWPSKLNDVSLKISSIAERLRIDAESELRQDCNIILMGDYNVEPYHDAVVHHLQSSRERELVLKRTNIFYNPCWKFLTTLQSSQQAIEKGTYYYPSGAFQRWHTIDQMMFSSSLLTGKWKLKDELVTIIDIDNLIDGLDLNYNESDHFPLSAIIERELP